MCQEVLLCILLLLQITFCLSNLSVLFLAVCSIFRTTGLVGDYVRVGWTQVSQIRPALASVLGLRQDGFEYILVNKRLHLL